MAILGWTGLVTWKYKGELNEQLQKLRYRQSFSRFSILVSTVRTQNVTWYIYNIKYLIKGMQVFMHGVQPYHMYRYLRIQKNKKFTLGAPFSPNYIVNIWPNVKIILGLKPLKEVLHVHIQKIQSDSGIDRFAFGHLEISKNLFNKNGGIF